jgi:TRAP-type C4-dicarboxylate transport system permease small subunit
MRRATDQIVSYLLIILMVLMLLQVIWQVFSRYILSHPSSITDELSRYLFMWIGLLGASYATGKNMHLSLTILPDRLSPLRRQKLEILINLTILLFAALVLVTGGIRLVYLTLTLGQTSASLRIPLGIIYSAIPLSGILTSFYCLHNILYPEFRLSNDGKH